MPKRLRYFVVEADDTCYVADAALLETAGLCSDEALAQAFGATGRWIEITLRRPTFARQQEISRRALIADAKGGFREDSLRLPAIRAHVMIGDWSGLPNPPDEDLNENKFESTFENTVENTFAQLPPLLANTIDAAIQAYMYPQIHTTPGFFDRVAGQIEILLHGGTIAPTRLHEGVRVYLAFRNGWPPWYACLMEMPAETACVLEFCLACEQQQRRDDHLLSIGQAMQTALLRPGHS